MRKKKTAKYALMAQFEREALQAFAKPNGTSRLFKIAAQRGKELEPAGALAGSTCAAGDE
ncbi:hypothetical protein LJY18_02225 [Pseudomonas sp. MMS21-TM103]|uniref:hypothetical protein n=1 Tax=Pseudomonas sp. MMS21 TM103 TaxID=2886506 RepID=UPI001EDEC55F|nr:hypothetical protein [Pseudomonas sp. MMS21 TM103]MCG4452119.1 hypothetical protein [Pseudomonas sp. MMS21 TM103]